MCNIIECKMLHHICFYAFLSTHTCISHNFVGLQTLKPTEIQENPFANVI